MSFVAAEENQFSEECEERSQMKPTFSSVIKDVEVVEGSAARFDCKIEGIGIQISAFRHRCTVQATVLCKSYGPFKKLSKAVYLGRNIY